ncbi:conserved hypothetical protein [Cellulomonas flavigena DSM 20109]|uniref:Uncharacterized protein n=1 Tax=Cellulomonas flavigena (strain ATCC 482 / DSM 20109 / BCRC 11376 / JCM 18109 / NBRC 3775 / NCIMB 8073 / NRS 134) TaxID=446466 RepID=D5UFJ9_CELFN|nr:hypothetical protein [Cellulomonas flavigena]ADG72958.1 conserved hypothetical protein [Cellulomonas flavigena DSM 20109]
MPPIDTLPSQFCWTKFGTEAGDEVDAIRARKESERRSGGGLFYWGIGNSVGPSLRLLVSQVREPEVLFTPMLSRPAYLDVNPASVASWRFGVGLDGVPHALRTGVVTSKSPVVNRARRHFALVCHSEDRLDVDLDYEGFTSSSVVNLRTGAQVGSSQVTSIVRRVPELGGGRPYRVAFRARLVAPYFLTLTSSSEPLGECESALPMQDALWA